MPAKTVSRKESRPGEASNPPELKARPGAGPGSPAAKERGEAAGEIRAPGKNFRAPAASPSGTQAQRR